MPTSFIRATAKLIGIILVTYLVTVGLVKGFDWLIPTGDSSNFLPLVLMAALSRPVFLSFYEEIMDPARYTGKIVVALALLAAILSVLHVWFFAIADGRGRYYFVAALAIVLLPALTASYTHRSKRNKGIEPSAERNSH